MLTWSNLHLLGISRQTLDTPMSKLDKARSVTMEIQWRDVNNSWELFVLYIFLGFQKYIDFVSYFDTAKEYRISFGRWIQTSTLSSTFFLCLCLLKIQNNPSWNTKIWFLPSDTKVTDVIWTAAAKMQHHPTKPVETFTPKPQTQIKILRSSQHDTVLPTSTKGPERDRRMDGRADRSEIWWYRTPISSIYPTFRHQLLPHRSIAYNVWLSEVEEPH